MISTIGLLNFVQNWRRYRSFPHPMPYTVHSLTKIVLYESVVPWKPPMCLSGWNLFPIWYGIGWDRTYTLRARHNFLYHSNFQIFKFYKVPTPSKSHSQAIPMLITAFHGILRVLQQNQWNRPKSGKSRVASCNFLQGALVLHYAELMQPLNVEPWCGIEKIKMAT